MRNQSIRQHPDFRRMLEEGCADEEIADRFGISKSIVLDINKRSENPVKNIKFRRTHRKLLLMLEENKDLTLPEVAKKYGYRYHSLWLLLRKHNLAERTRKAVRGHFRSQEKIRAVLECRRANPKMPATEICKRVGVCINVARDILHKAKVCAGN